jgi:hypothetical protein
MTPRLGRCLEDIRHICYIESMRRDDVIAKRFTRSSAVLRSSPKLRAAWPMI